MADGPLKLTIKFETPRKGSPTSVDYYVGAKTLLGYSKLLNLTLHYVFNEEIRRKATAVEGFDIELGLSRRGSWEQDLFLHLTTPGTAELVNDLGKDALYDVLKWLFLGMIGIAYHSKNKKAEEKINQLSHDISSLKRTVESALKEAHTSVSNQDIQSSVLLQNEPVAEFNRASLKYIEDLKIEPRAALKSVYITKLNGRTGTGRFSETPKGKSFSFYPETELSDENITMLADNLAKNTRGDFDTVDVLLKKVSSPAGKTLYYYITGV
jgi:hypothetical protein